MRHDTLGCSIEGICHRTAWRLGPETRPYIVGAPAKQHIEVGAMRREKRMPPSETSMGRGPVGLREIIFAGGLDHAVQRDVFHDRELSHCGFPSPGVVSVSWRKSILRTSRFLKAPASGSARRPLSRAPVSKSGHAHASIFLQRVVAFNGFYHVAIRIQKIDLGHTF